MSANEVQWQLDECQEIIRGLQDELAETNRGLLALNLELENRVDTRTAELHEAHEELERTNSELVQLTIELEDRVAQRTSELQAKTDELHALTQQLWQTTKLATMGELAASVAHELNNPLTTINLHLESLIEELPATGENGRQVRIIDQEVDRMAKLVANLLQFSRTREQQISSFDVEEELEKTVEIIQYVFRKSGIAVKKKFAADLPLIQADRQKLRQLFLNLIMNSCDATPPGGTITLRTGRAKVDVEQQGIFIEVTDSGMGIAPENLARIMEPFFTTKPEGKGTGLGLAISRRIVQEHRGLIEFVSSLGVGTTVRLTFPIGNETNGKIASSE